MNARSDREDPPGRRALLVGAGCYLLFIVYGSLVPLDFNPRPLAAAWRDFLAVRYFELGVESRADWIANGVLYMPLAYLLSAGLAASRGSVAAQLLRAVAVFLACAALALGVEFTQLFFPPRTVSINDIIAELVGSALGIAVWCAWGGALERLWNEMKRGGLVAIRAAVIVYVVAYLTLSLFPYDFYISAQEFSQKLASGSYGLLVAPAACGGLAICMSKLVAEMIVVVPLGVLLGMVLGKAALRAYATAVWYGLALGFAIEAAQLFIASGVSQGVSLLTRAAGLSIGVALHRRVRLQWLLALQPIVVPAVLLASVPYLLALMWLNGWFSAGWTDIDRAHAKLQQLSFLPFYYHYFTTEHAALRSLLINAAMYLPVGLGYWAWTLRRSHMYSDGIALIPALLAASLALVMEVGKLFVPGKRPDPTDVLIAAVAAAAAYLLAAQVQRWALQGRGTPARANAPELPPATRRESDAPSLIRPLLSALLLGGVGVVLLNYPLGGGWPLLALGVYAAVLWRHPWIWLPALLAVLPLLNFASWTGWILLNELDLFIAVTLAVRLLQPRPDAAGQGLSGGAKWALGLLAVSFFASAVVGLVPLSPFDQNALVNYYSGFNALRSLKGFAWALALLPLLIGEMRHPQRMEPRFFAGILAGLCGVVAVALWERAVFTDLLDFSADYRIMGTFPELHTGGGDIHAYLVLAIPFAAAWIFIRPSAARVATGAVLFALASYALAVTFTRGGYVGYFGAILVLAIALTIHLARQRASKVKRLAVAGVLAVAGLAVIVPIMTGPFMEARFASAHGDAGTRTNHWARAIDMMDPRLSTTLFGMGLGSFPRTFLTLARDDASATFSYTYENGNSFARLGSGKALYFGQRVSVEAGKNYTLEVDLRGSRANAGLGASVCEKSEQNSFQCKGLGFQVTAAGENWQHRQVTFNSDAVGSVLGRFQLRRPVFLSFSNSERDTVFEIDNVRMLDESGRDLIANGDFSRGGARWYFATDDHVPWHIFNLWVQILFEQGWLGVLTFAVMIVVSLLGLAGKVWRGDVFAGTLLAGICGFLLIGLTESLFDGPRVTTFFFLLLFAALRRT